MFKKILIVLILVVVGTTTGNASTAKVDEAQLGQVLENIKNIEAIFSSYAFNSDVEYYQDGKKEFDATFFLAISSNNTMALYKSPSYDKGKIILQNEGNYFFYFPKTKRYIRVSPRNTLFGNISFGDIVKPPLLEHYKVENAAQGDGVINVSFILKNNSSNLPYYRKVIKYEILTKRIKSIESYSRREILLGKSVNLEFQDVNGVQFPVFSKIVDIKSPDSYAYQKNYSVKVIELADKYFNPNYLKDVESYLMTKIDKM